MKFVSIIVQKNYSKIEKYKHNILEKLKFGIIGQLGTLINTMKIPENPSVASFPEG